MTVSLISDHVQQALGRLISQYANAPNIISLVTALANRVQVVENAIYAVASSKFSNGTAVGAQLDTIGALVGVARNGQPDAVYRLFILGTIAKNTSRGTLSDIATVAQNLFGAQSVFISSPNSFGCDQADVCAEIMLAVGSPSVDLSLLPFIVTVIQQCLPEGVQLVSITSYNAAGTMATNGPQPWVQGLGGPLANVIYQANA